MVGCARYRLQMEADHNCSADLRLQGYAGFLVAVMQQNQQKKTFGHFTSIPLFLAKPGPS